MRVEITPPAALTRDRGGHRRKLAIATVIFVSTVVALTGGEAALRAVGFSYRTFPTVQFGWPEPEMIVDRYVPDRDLFWVPRDYEQRLSAARKAAARVVFMGDSCTEIGSYPEYVLARFANTVPTLANGVKLGVSGWSTEQGVAQLKRDILPLYPAVITMYFGWNDHWVALGPTDDEARPGRSWFWLSQHLRLAQLVTKAELAHTAKSLANRPNRVSLDRYRANLATMVRLARGIGARPVVITAPSNHVKGSEPVALALRHVRSLGELIPLHQQYVSATRDVARHEGATLCDAAAAFEMFGPTRARYFARDGIHLTEAGNEQLAGIVSRCIERAVSLRETPE